MELPIFSLLPKVYQLGIPAYADSLLLTFVCSNSDEFELFKNDTLIQTLQTKAEKVVTLPIKKSLRDNSNTSDKIELFRIKDGNRQSVFLQDFEALFISPSEITLENDQFIRVFLQDKLFNFNELSQNELPFQIESIIPISKKEYVIKPRKSASKQLEIEGYFTGLIS